MYEHSSYVAVSLGRDEIKSHFKKQCCYVHRVYIFFYFNFITKINDFMILTCSV